MKSRRKADRMSDDPEPGPEALEWLFAADQPMSAIERSKLLLQAKPVGFIVERDGNQYTLVARGQIPAMGPKDEPGRRDLVKALVRPMRLVGPRDMDQIHEWAHHVHSQAPWMAPVSSYLMGEMEKRVRHGFRFAGFDPVMVHGAPGVGKTHYARMAAQETGAPVLTLDGSSMVSVFQVAGIERGWSSAGASPVVRFIADTGIANPVVIIDEVDKVGHGDSKAGSPHSALLGMLERLTAREWRCPYTELTVDLSRVSWILTANDIARVPQPLMDRCRIIRANSPTEQNVRTFLLARMDGQDPAIIAEAAKAARGMSLRRAARLADAVIAAGNRRMLN